MILVNYVVGGPNIDNYAKVPHTVTSVIRVADCSLILKVIFFARIGQSLSHIASASSVAVNFRFAFFVAQLVAIGLAGWSTFQAL